MSKDGLNLYNKLSRKIRATMFSAEGLEFGTITLLAIVVGVISGYAAIGFYLLIDKILHFSFGMGEKALATGASSLPAC